MKYGKLLLSVMLVILAVVLTGCGEKICEVDADCQRDHFTGRCVDNNCSYIPIPNECGNDRCEAGASENECTCPQDCGFCEGSAPGSSSMSLACDAENNCASDIDQLSQQLETHASAELRGAGGSFRVESALNDPFNVRRDTMEVLIYMSSAAQNTANHRIERIELEAKGEDNRIIPLASYPVGRPLFGVGRENGVTVPVRFDFATGESEEVLRDLSMNIRYSFVQSSASGDRVVEPVPLRNFMRSVAVSYVVPDAVYECPESCDDSNPGTLDVCDASTDFFCEHRPKSGVCGNFVCDNGENSCNCEVDCGVCAGETQFLRYACEQAVCQASVKTGLSVSQQTIGPVEFGQGGFKVRTTYTYNDPFNADTDVIIASFELISKDASISDVSINEIRASESGQLLGSSASSVTLSEVGASQQMQLRLNSISEAESNKVISIEGDYEFTREGQKQPIAKFRKTLNKGVYLNP